jgi:hypothetical protein
MKKATMIWLIAGGTVAFLAVIFVVVPLVTHWAMEKKLRARVAKVYSADEIVFQDLRASNFGVESKGPSQLRGNGALVLTADRLHFFQLVPDREIVIPLDTIKEVTTVRTHLGKTVGRKLLHVSFTVEGGNDSVAFSVASTDAWLSKLERKPDQSVR